MFDDFGKELSNKLNNDDKIGIKSEFNELIENNVTVVYPGSDNLPLNYLRFVKQFGISPVIFCSGNLSLLNSTGVSIVGSRDVSNEGMKFAEYLSAELAKNGINKFLVMLKV